MCAAAQKPLFGGRQHSTAGGLRGYPLAGGPGEDGLARDDGGSSSSGDEQQQGGLASRCAHVPVNPRSQRVPMTLLFMTP